MTIQIPDDLARELAAIAATQQLSVEQLAVERLRGLVERPTSPAPLLRAIQALSRPSASAVDDLETAITEGRLPVREQGVFDRSS
jgi:hypothetical protein